MKIIGLSGGIASGKNLVAEIFSKNGAAVFDADKEVHALLEGDKSTIAAIKKNFPESFVEKKVNRKILGEIVFADEKKLKILEGILHPKVRKNYQYFIKRSRQEKSGLVVLNIPLLLETKGYEYDLVIAVIASKTLRKKRFLERAKKQNPKNFLAEKKNLEKKFEQILKKQMHDKQRKERADFVIRNDGSKAELRTLIKRIISLS